MLSRFLNFEFEPISVLDLLTPLQEKIDGLKNSKKM